MARQPYNSPLSALATAVWIPTGQVGQVLFDKKKRSFGGARYISGIAKPVRFETGAPFRSTEEAQMCS